MGCGGLNVQSRLRFFWLGSCLIIFAWSSSGVSAVRGDCLLVNQRNYVQTHQHMAAAPTQSMPKRLEWLSRQLLSSPYVFFVLGDGEQDQIDQCPLYRLDAFDCETFVTSVLALAFSHSRSGYEKCLRAIRYHDGQVGFLTRNHFTSVDWNQQNQQQGRLKDITKTWVDAQHRPVFQWSKTWIDKANWIQHLSLDRVRRVQPDKTIKLERLRSLKQQGRGYPKVYAALPYIPLNVLFTNGHANQGMFDQIPDGAIIEIVRPNWAIQDKIGTHLDISHLGFAFRHDGQLWFRNASSEFHRVVDEPLIPYLRRALSSPTIKGINIQVVLPSGGC